MRFWLLALYALIATNSSAQTIVKKDREWSSEGPYLAFASPSCQFQSAHLVEGRDYQNSVSYGKGNLAKASNVTFAWNYPRVDQRPTICGVFGYSFVAWRNYDGGIVMQPGPSVQVKAVQQFDVSFGIDSLATFNSYNVLFEFYVTRTPGNAGDKALEVGILATAPPETRNWAKGDRQLGTCADTKNKRSYATSLHGTYLTFVPTVDYSWGGIDVASLLKCAAGVIPQDGYINGAAVGFEQLGSYGTGIVRGFSVALR